MQIQSNKNQVWFCYASKKHMTIEIQSLVIVFVLLVVVIGVLLFPPLVWLGV